MMLSLTALGMVNPLGRDKAEVSANLFAGSRAGLVMRDDLLAERPVRVGPVTWPLPAVPDRLRDFDCRNNRLAMSALEQIEPEIAAARQRYGPDRIAVVMGTSTAGLADGEAALAARLADGVWPAPFRYSQQEIGNLAAFVAHYLALSGPAYTIATACSSSGKALASAARLIHAGICDAAIVGGVDTLCRLTANGFASLESVAADYCSPFSRNRDGINIGEGAALFLMSRDPARVRLLGVGESSDAYHISAPAPDGAGAIAAMQQALDAAGLPPTAIDYVNLHGTATPLNDAMESRAVAATFGVGVACSSTKGMTGHMLGAAGAGEAAVLWLALDPDFSDGALPPHAWDGAVDSEIALTNFVTPGTRAPVRDRAAMLSNSFAFGGSNVAVILGRGW